MVTRRTNECKHLKLRLGLPCWPETNTRTARAKFPFGHTRFPKRADCCSMRCYPATINGRSSAAQENSLLDAAPTVTKSTGRKQLSKQNLSARRQTPVQGGRRHTLTSCREHMCPSREVYPKIDVFTPVPPSGPHDAVHRHGRLPRYEPALR